MTKIEEYIPEAVTSLTALATDGICYPLALKRKLKQTGIDGPRRIIVSCGKSHTESVPNTCTVQVHRFKAREPVVDLRSERVQISGCLHHRLDERAHGCSSLRASGRSLVLRFEIDKSTDEHKPVARFCRHISKDDVPLRASKNFSNGNLSCSTRGRVAAAVWKRAIEAL